MTSTRTPLDRRLNHVQFTIQEEINIRDDRIRRFAEYYQVLQSQISDEEDIRNRLNYKSEQVQHLKKGKIILKNTSKQTMMSKLVADYEATKKELENSHHLLISQLKEDFENTYEQIDKEFEKKENEKVKPIEDEIKRTVDLINKMKLQATQVDNSGESGDEQEVERTHEFEKMKIQTMEAKLKEQSQIRLSTLLDYKKQMQECVHTLEEMENKHISKMDQLKDRLDSIDATYKEQIKRNQEKQKRETTEMKRSIKDAQDKVKSVSKSLNHTQKRQKDDILKVTQESEYLRVELMTIKKKESQKRETNNDIQNYQTKLSELNLKLKERESILLKVRADNETLKKEIARVSQEKQIAKRRAALNIM